MAEEGKEKALNLALDQIEKQFGKGSIMKLGGEGTDLSIKTISTSSIALDTCLGIGGVPSGRVTEIFGPEASGKTTLALHIIAEAQKEGGVAAFIDAENALDPSYAKNLGVDIENLWVSQPDYGEQALEITETLVRSGAIDVIVIDSVAALVPKAELEGEMGDKHVGLQARLMSQALRKVSSAINKSQTAVIFVNQVRTKIGTFYGNPETTSGGRALKFYSSVRMRIKRKGSIKSKGEKKGIKAKVRVVKNKVAPPFKEAEVSIIYGKGISRSSELLHLGHELDIIERRGAWYSYGDHKLGQGQENARKFLNENEDIANEIEEKIRKKLFPDESGDQPKEDEEEEE